MSDSDSVLAVSPLTNGSVRSAVDRKPPALISVNASIGAKIAVIKEEPSITISNNNNNNNNNKECKICGESLPDGILYLKHILLHGEGPPSSDGGENQQQRSSGVAGRRLGSVIGVSASVRVDLINRRLDDGGDGDDDEGNENNDVVINNNGLGNGAVEACYDELIERVDAEVSNREGTYVCKVGERPFRCPICSRTFSLASNRRKHMLTHANYKPHKCRICGHCFSQKGNLLRHLASVHNNNNDDELRGSPKDEEDVDMEEDVDGEPNDEDVDMDNQGDLVINEDEESEQKPEDADVKPSGSLLYQMLKPKEERPPTPAKTPPSGPVPQPISLLMRILTPSSVKSENKADQDKFSNKDNTSSNGPSPTAITGGKVHQNGKAPVCPLCGIKVTDTSLDEHLKRHPNGRPYQCDTCVRGFSSKVALINHLASSHATACPTCGLSFTQKDNLARHMATANHFPRIGSLPSHVPPLMEAPPAAARVDPIALLSRVAAQADMAAALAAVSAPLNLSIKSERSGHTPPPAVPLVLNKATIKEPEGRNETVQCRWCDEILERWCDFRGHLKRKHNMKNLPASGRDSKAMREMIRTHGNSQLDSVPPSRNPSRASSASPHLAALINRAPVVKRPWPSPAATPSPKQSRSSSPAAAAGPSRPKIHKPDFEKMIEQMQSRILPSAANPLETADAINGAPAISDAERSVSFEEMVSEIMNQQSRQSTASSADFDDEDENSRASESLVVEPDPEALIKYEVNSDTESGEEEMEDESTMDSLHQMPLLLKAPIGCAAAPPTPPVVTAPAAARKQPPPLIKINMCQPDVKPNIVSPPVSNGTPPEGPGSQRRIGLAGEETGPQPSIEQVYQKWAIEADGVAPVEPTFPPNRRRSRNTAASSCSNGAPKGRQCDSGSEEPVQRRDDSTPGPSSSHHNRISCQLCDKRVFSSQEELGCHVASTHPNHYFCVNCSQVVDGHLDALEEHMASCFKQKLARRLEEMAARASGD